MHDVTLTQNTHNTVILAKAGIQWFLIVLFKRESRFREKYGNLILHNTQTVEPYTSWILKYFTYVVPDYGPMTLRFL